MCGPIEKCCCCFPANVGVKLIGMFLVMCDISGMIYSTVILHINNKVSQAVSVITVKTTFLLLAGVSRGAGPRDAELHLVRCGGDLRLLRPHHHQHCSPHRSSQEKQARFSQGRNFEKLSLFHPARFCFIPWLVAHMVTIIGLFIGALVIMIFFIFLFPLVNYALLAIIPLISAAILLYW